MRPDDDGEPWVCLLDATSSPADLERAIAESVRRCLDDLAEQLAQRAMTPAEREAALRLAEPIIARQNRAGLLKAYESLQTVR